MVSDGKSLVIKTRSSYYQYSLKKTPLNFILDKKYLIKKISNLKGRVIDNSLINFTLIENDNTINVFFDNKTFDLIGWQNNDIYQNFNITYLSSIRKNRFIPKNKFKLPSRN